MAKVNVRPNAEQKRWMDIVVDWATDYSWVLVDDGWGRFQIHHVVGRTARHNKIPIGHEFIIPLPFSHHDPNATPMHENHVERNKRGFISQYGLQSDLFFKMVDHMESIGVEVPISKDVLDSIRDINK